MRTAARPHDAVREVASGRHDAIAARPATYGIELADLGRSAPVIRRACKQCEDEAMVIRRSPKGAAHGSADIGSYIAASAGRGRPLDAGVRSAFERSLGVGLGSVRVVDDLHAARAADALGARAFTFGPTIWFGRGEHRPHTDDGKHLLAHEVAHAVQQRDAAPSIQREVVVGGVHDPAEAAADRAADAMVRGVAAEPGMRSDAVLRRRCIAAPVLVADPRDTTRIVTCPPDETRWTVSRKTDDDPDHKKPETRVTTTAQLPRGERVVLGITICRGHHKAAIKAQAELTDAEARALANAISGTSVLTGVTLRPELVVVVTSSQSWEFERRGGPTVDLGTRSVTGGGGGITVQTDKVGPFGVSVEHQNAQGGTPESTFVNFDIPTEKPTRPIDHVDCSFIPDRYECRRTIPATSGTPGIPAIKRQGPPSTRLYALFDHNSSQIKQWRFEGDETRYGVTDPEARRRIDGMVLNGYRMKYIWGFASPEGEQQRDKPTELEQFEGNIKLSRKRATNVKNALAVYPTVSGFELFPAGLGELYGADLRGKERPEGRDLENAAIEHYATEDVLAPRDLAAFRKLPREAQLQQAYDMLRRVEIVWERELVLAPAEPGQPGTPEHPGDVEPCPKDVEAAARASQDPKDKRR